MKKKSFYTKLATNITPRIGKLKNIYFSVPEDLLNPIIIGRNNFNQKVEKYYGFRNLVKMVK